MTKIIDILIGQNPWWQGEGVSEEYGKKPKRTIFDELVKELEHERVSTLVGLRRVGKTTLLYQLIDCLLSKGVSGKNILYVLLDQAEFLNLELPIKKVIDEYLLHIKKKSLSEIDEPLYIFIDEVNKDNTWAQEVKNIWDIRKIKFFVSGSSSLFIRKKTRESLAGRSITNFISPLDFVDFLRIKFNIKCQIKIGSFNIEEIYDRIKESNILLEKNKLLPKFIDFMKKGGFPELIDLPENQSKRFLEEDILEKILFIDIPQIYGVRDEKKLLKVFLYFARQGITFLNKDSVARNFGLNKITVDNYLNYLESSFLIKSLEKYAKSVEATLRSRDKVYCGDFSFYRYFNECVDESYIAEIMVGSKLREWARIKRIELCYWKKRKEVDFVFENIPIEVKYQERIKSEDLAGIKDFQKVFRINEGILITKNRFEMRDGILMIPLWVFELLEI